MTTARRFVRFNLVGAMGVAVQLGIIWSLAEIAGVPYLLATAVGVSLAVANNFAWHVAWTWGDRELNGARAAQVFLLFAAANGAVSLISNLALMIPLVEGAGLPVVPANLIAIGISGLVNFWLGDRIVFATPAGEP